ncbi:sigma-54-dependent transcriptional regulator [Mangrovibacterium lignilyticum]|uniref:sigma-54-dependent transcriptional regulator n=1 Tax=Mangrovibacterium lignilyticum TaxID=2668052 RepID=UPI0013D1251E|nr:sigma-54 dependent transcriptional regulator [Mangrovibacterium lignilyticum]
MGKILIIDDDSFICEILKKHLKNHKYQVETAFSAQSALQIFKNKGIELVLCDFRLPDSSGLEVLQKVRAMNPDIPVIIMTAYADVRMAVKLMKMGADDYITKPIQQEELISLIAKLLKKPKAETVASKAADSTFKNGEFIIGNSPRIRQVVDLAKKVAPTNMSVIIEGETGTGKEYIARFIHDNSLRRDKPFVAIDCGAIPKDIANSELFGHVKGSFTGAVVDKEGVFQKADGGTLFLDEIGNLTYEIQLKLLRTIQEREVSRVGDDKSRKVDIRIIAATNEQLSNEVQEGTFREDLYHRVNEFKLSLPPIRERGDDILVFVSNFIRQANTELNRSVVGFDRETEQILLNYPWYGNLRELRNVVKRSVLMATGDTIDKSCLPVEIIFPENGELAVAEVKVNRSESMLKNASSEIEKQLIMKTIQEAGYNKSKAARILNIDRKTLYNKMKLYDIDL